MHVSFTESSSPKKNYNRKFNVGFYSCVPGTIITFCFEVSDDSFTHEALLMSDGNFHTVRQILEYRTDMGSVAFTIGGMFKPGPTSMEPPHCTHDFGYRKMYHLTYYDTQTTAMDISQAIDICYFWHAYIFPDFPNTRRTFPCCKIDTIDGKMQIVHNHNCPYFRLLPLSMKKLFLYYKQSDIYNYSCLSPSGSS